MYPLLTGAPEFNKITSIFIRQTDQLLHYPMDLLSSAGFVRHTRTRSLIFRIKKNEEKCTITFIWFSKHSVCVCVLILLVSTSHHHFGPAHQASVVMLLTYKQVPLSVWDRLDLPGSLSWRWGSSYCMVSPWGVLGNKRSITALHEGTDAAWGRADPKDLLKKKKSEIRRMEGNKRSDSFSLWKWKTKQNKGKWLW